MQNVLMSNQNKSIVNCTLVYENSKFNKTGSVYTTVFSLGTKYYHQHGIHVDGLVQDYSNFIAEALELLHFYTNPLKYKHLQAGIRSGQPCLVNGAFDLILMG